MIRDDVSDRLVHLTRGDSPSEAAEKFRSIIAQRKLIGGTGDIRGGYRCVCFSEAPISKLSHILAAPRVHGMRYSPFGVLVSKKWLYAQGGRPVIYQSNAEFELLREEQRYRHVRYEPTRDTIDVSWEREWRIRCDELPFIPDDVTLVVPSRKWQRWMQRDHAAMLQRRSIPMFSVPSPSSVLTFPWNFIVLEDLGVPIDDRSDPPETGWGKPKKAIGLASGTEEPPQSEIVPAS